MNGLGDGVLAVMESLLDDLLAAFDGIPDAELATWLPAAAREEEHAMNTFSAIAVHTASAGMWMLVHQTFGEDWARDRDAEFRAVATRAEIDRLYADWRDELRSRLGRLEEIDLTLPPGTIRETRPGWTRAHWLLHMVDHTGLHLGHVQVQRQLWEHDRRAS